MSQPRPLDEQEQRVWRGYRAMNVQLTARLQRQLQADAGLSLADFGVLVQLIDQPDERVRVFALAQALQWEKSRLSHHLARMQRRGLIVRQDCPDDARGAFIVLTPQGRRAIARATPRHVNTVRDLFFDQLTTEQVGTLHTIAQRVLACLEHDRLGLMNVRGEDGGMAEPDPGGVPQPVLSPLTTAAIFLVMTIDPGGEPVARELLSTLAGLQRSVGFRVPEGRLSCVVGVGSQAWDRLFSGPRPAELHPFRELIGPKHRAMSTPGDLLFHIRATQLYPCFELACHIMNQLSGAVTVRDEVHGFKYFDLRDLLGFVDGTENPVGPAASAAVLIGEEDPEFVGGSYVIVQKYLHDLRAWNALPAEAQEKVIGRTKLSNIELADAVKPDNSHVTLTTITDPDGTERQILRDNMPFGTVGTREFGTYFIGYARTPAVTEKMLENMFFGNPPGNYDRILEFSTPVTGTLFFAPAADFLDNLPDPPCADTVAEAGRRCS